MNKNNLPYSEPTNLKIALISSFDYFAFSDSKFIGSIKNESEWISIPDVPGTLQHSCTMNESGFYDVLISFRLSYSEIENQKFITQFLNEPLTAMLTTAGGKNVIAGTAENYLNLTIVQTSGFDGYECTLKGTQKEPEMFV